jgi:2-dehydro-3-deoxygluconokinase
MDNKMKYRVLVVGCGTISHEWFPVLKKRPDCEICGVVDINPEAAKERTATYEVECPIYEDYKIAIDELKPDVVVDLTFPKCHHDITVYALRSGCHIFGEKPMAMNREDALDMLKTAKELGLTVSFDGNFRSRLWTWEQARDYCTQCLPYVDVLFGIEPYHLYKDETDPSAGDWKDGLPMQPDYEQQDEVFQHFAERYPNLKCIARHVRYAYSGSENSLKAFMWYRDHTFESRLFTFNILDRVGGGDAFASGLIYAMMNEFKPMDMINFAVASSAIKHTIHGDANITDDAQSIIDLMDMSYDIRR